MSKKIMFALSLCRKAGALITGFDAVKKSVNEGKAYIVMTAEDLSEKTKKRVDFFCEDFIDVHIIPMSQFDLLTVCKKPSGVFAVTNKELAKLCLKSLNDGNSTGGIK